jgi:hypothetical protein
MSDATCNRHIFLLQEASAEHFIRPEPEEMLEYKVHRNSNKC